MDKNPKPWQILGMYKDQIHGAGKRGIGFLLTFEEWLDIWQKSGHFHERGRGAGKYVMGRYGDKGPYAVGNVKIIRHADNVSEGRKGKKASLETRRKQSLSHTGLKHTPEAHRKMHLAQLGNKKMLGKKHSDVTKSKMSRALVGNKRWLGKKHSEETKAKMSHSWMMRRLERRIEASLETRRG